MNDATALKSVEALLRELEAAWDRGNAPAWSARCTPDVDFINLLGMYVQGPAEVAAVHQKIFKGPYKDSTLKFTVDRLRVLADDAVLAIVPGELRIPAGPVKGVVRTIATMLVVRRGDAWLLASFQNTKREATAADHTATMLDAITRQ